MTNVAPCANLLAAMIFGGMTDNKRREIIPGYLGLDPYLYGPEMFAELAGYDHQLHDDRSAMDQKQLFSQAMLHLSRVLCSLKVSEFDAIPSQLHSCYGPTHLSIECAFHSRFVMMMMMMMMISLVLNH